MSGLATLAYFERELCAVLAEPAAADPARVRQLFPLNPRSTSAIFADGALASWAVRSGTVRVTAATEAGAIIIADLDPLDAVALGTRLANVAPMPAFGVNPEWD